MKKHKNFKKIIGAGLSLALLFMFTAAYPASANDIPAPAVTIGTTINYNSFEGTVKETVSYYNQSDEVVEGSMYVSVEGKDGETVNFFVDEETYMITDSKITAGAKVRGFYDARLPVIMIYPPQYRAVAIAADLPEIQNVKIDKFDKNLLSEDKMLKLNVSENTEIIYQDGTKFDGKISELGNRELIVVYSIATMSIPAQTPPLKIIILNEKSVSVVKVDEDIIVNGEKIDSPAPYIDNGVVMLPVRAIAEALGYDVIWEAETQSILIGKGISMTIGKDYYIYMRTAPIELGTAPALIDDNTYVPIEFFSSVMRIRGVEISNNQVVINDLISDESESVNASDSIIIGD